MWSLLFCPLADPDQLREDGTFSASVRAQAIKNSHERYHWFPQAAITGGGELPVLVADFKQVVALPPELVYHDVRTGTSRRACAIASPYLYQLIQRFYSFQSRIGVD
jgi:hypothetical protein